MTATEVFDELGIRYLESGHHHCRPGWLQIESCFSCGSNSYHLGFNTAARYFYCWRCRYHPHWEVFKALNIPRHLAKELRNGFEGELPQERVRKGLVEPPYRGPLLPAHKRYLRSRHWDPEAIAKLWQVEGIGIAPERLSWRLYIPIAHNGKRVSWTSRAIGENIEQRYVSASAAQEAMNHKHVVYGMEFVRGAAIIVEGPTDVWNIGPGAVCLFGLAFSAAQVRVLANVPRRYVCFDSSRSALVQARALASQLACLPGHTGIVQLDAEDPGSASEREVQKVRKLLD